MAGQRRAGQAAVALAGGVDASGGAGVTYAIDGYAMVDRQLAVRYGHACVGSRAPARHQASGA